MDLRKRFFGFSNSLLDQDAARSTTAFLILIGAIAGPSLGLAVKAGSDVWSLALVTLASFLIASLAYLLIRLLRWNLLLWANASEIEWYVKQNPDLIVGVGPGGGFLACAIAKLLNDRINREPPVIVANRSFKILADGGLEGWIEPLPLSPTPQGRALVVTPEVHAGGTLRKVCEELQARGLQFSSFALIQSKTTKFPAQRVVVLSDARGLIPWKDHPAVEGVKASIMAGGENVA